MSSLDHAPQVLGTIYKTSALYALVDTTLKQLGGANAVTEVPSGMNVLLGIYAHMYITTPTTDEAVNAWGYLDTEDGFNLKPFEFLYPPSGCSGNTTSSTNAMAGIFYPINCPVVPGGRIAAYAQSFENSTAEPFCGVTYLFGKNVVLPKRMDDHPGWHRWRKVGTHLNANLTSTVAAGFAPENQYQFTLSAIGGCLTEVGGLLWTTTQDPAACVGSATFQVNSADVPVMPMEFCSDAFGAVLGGNFAHDAKNTVTRRPCSAFGERVVHIDAQLAMHGSAPITTGYFVSMVEFVRRGERGPALRG